MKPLLDLFKEKPYLAWYVKDKKSLSRESMVEHILNYGDWEDYKEAEKALGVKQIKKIFKQLIKRKRVNLRPQTINYFKGYFEEYA
jgi:hypothetical protein